MNDAERRRIMKTSSIGPRMVAWLAAAGYRSLEDFADETPASVCFRLEAETGVQLDGNGIKALENLIADAKAASGQTNAP